MRDMDSQTRTFVAGYGYLDPPVARVPAAVRRRLARLATDAGENPLNIVIAYLDDTEERLPLDGDVVRSVVRVTGIGRRVSIVVFLNEAGIEVDQCLIRRGADGLGLAST
jgi:hypothetical protein